MRLLLIFCIILLLMCGAVGRLFAEAPTTPKILFTSTRDGNRDVHDESRWLRTGEPHTTSRR